MPDEVKDMKTCRTCQQSKAKSTANFTVQSCNQKTHKAYYASTCKVCMRRKKREAYVPKPADQQRKRGPSGVLDRDTAKKNQVEQLMFEGFRMNRIASVCGVNKANLYRLRRAGCIAATDHQLEVSELVA